MSEESQQKEYWVCEMDAGDNSDIKHGCFESYQAAQDAIDQSRESGCEIPLYVIEKPISDRCKTSQSVKPT